jgi:hypothetical protein
MKYDEWHEGASSMEYDEWRRRREHKGSETDPTGRSAHDAGAKLDAGKLRYALVMGSFAKALKEVTRIGTYGAAKYSDNGWLDVPDGFNRYSDAQLRHWFDAVLEGRDSTADDSDLFHLSHEAWNALARLELFLRGMINDGEDS